MPNWGYLLLIAFVGLGLSDRLTWRRAGKSGAILTALVMVYVFAHYGALR